MRTHPFPPPRIQRRLLAAAAFGATALSGGCLRNPSADAATAQALTEVTDQLGAMQQETAAMQDQIDSLRTALAHHDTLLRRLANMAGVPLTP